MTTTNLRGELKERIDQLSKERLQTAADFLKYLEQLESDEATQELLRIPGIERLIEEGQKAIAEGQMTPVEELRRKY
jgi:hypothetical protein